MWRIEYFEIMAQIGPVLVLAYVLEQGLRSKSQDPSTWERLYGFVTALAAEATALVVTAGVAQPTRTAGMLTAGLMLTSAGHLPLTFEEGSFRPPNPATWVALILVVSGAGIAITAPLT